MEKVTKFGAMDRFMKVTGEMVKLMVKEGSYMQMEIFMKANGKMTNQMDLEHISIKMEQNM